LVLQTRFWLPGRKLVMMGDSGFATLEFLAALSRRGVACVIRLNFDAALYDPTPPRLPGTNGRPPDQGQASGDPVRKRCHCQLGIDGKIAAAAGAAGPSDPCYPVGGAPRRTAAGRPRIAGDRPYFLCLGTIEPRKSHITLLHIWRRFAETHGADAPRLLIVGRRDWENEHVVDMLVRCESTRPHVVELGLLPGSQVARLMAGARALLMPSFCEGYGLPAAEALASGVPVVCSDICFHREIGHGVPDFIDPIDSSAWMRAVLDYAAEGSLRREAQVRRLKGVVGHHLAGTRRFYARLRGCHRAPPTHCSRSPCNILVWHPLGSIRQSLWRSRIFIENRYLISTGRPDGGCLRIASDGVA